MDYKNYKLNVFQYILYGSIFLFLLATYSRLFYDSFIPVLLFIPCMYPYFNFVSRSLCSKRQRSLILQFKDMITSISASLNTGYSLENALVESLNEMSILYGENSLICMELELIKRKLLLNVPVGDLFGDLAIRSGMDEISVFSEIINISKKSGGDMISIIRTSAFSISSKISLEDEIHTSIAAKKFELYIMAFLPVFIMFYVNLTQPGFYESMYHNIIGIIIMSICLAIYFSALVLANKILRIEV